MHPLLKKKISKLQSSVWQAPSGLSHTATVAGDTRKTVSCKLVAGVREEQHFLTHSSLGSARQGKDKWHSLPMPPLPSLLPAYTEGLDTGTAPWPWGRPSKTEESSQACKTARFPLSGHVQCSCRSRLLQMVSEWSMSSKFYVLRTTKTTSRLPEKTSLYCPCLLQQSQKKKSNKHVEKIYSLQSLHLAWKMFSFHVSPAMLGAWLSLAGTCQSLDCRRFRSGWFKVNFNMHLLDASKTNQNKKTTKSKQKQKPLHLFRVSQCRWAVKDLNSSWALWPPFQKHTAKLCIIHICFIFWVWRRREECACESQVPYYHSVTSPSLQTRM